MKHLPKISLSMIVKNEAEHLRECLESVTGITDEIIIVDTGSSDSTVSIAEEFGASVYFFDWTDDFSAARNYALSKSSGNWILYLDADERLSRGSVEELKRITLGNRLTGCRCIVNSVDDINGRPKYNRYTRLFSSHPGIKFTGRVHEQIDESLIENGYSLVDADVEIIHVGYNIPAKELKKKAERNLAILKEEYFKNASVYNAYQLANTYSILDDDENARVYYLEAVSSEGLNSEYKAHAYLNLAGYEFKKHSLDAALGYLQQGLQNDELNPVLNLLAADVYFRLNRKEDSFLGCIFAYMANEKIRKEKTVSALTIGIKPEAALCKGIYYSLLASDKARLNYFTAELRKHNRDLTLLVKKLNGNEALSAEGIKKISGMMSEDNLDAILLLLENYTDKKTALEILLGAVNKFSLNAKYMNTLGLMYYENGMNAEAVRIFEGCLSLKEKDPASVFYLISVLIRENKPEKVPEVLLFAEKEFGHIPEFNAKLEILKEKLGMMFKG